MKKGHLCKLVGLKERDASNLALTFLKLHHFSNLQIDAFLQEAGREPFIQSYTNLNELHLICVCRSMFSYKKQGVSLSFSPTQT
jgi:hypothetical protein